MIKLIFQILQELVLAIFSLGVCIGYAFYNYQVTNFDIFLLVMLLGKSISNQLDRLEK